MKRIILLFGIILASQFSFAQGFEVNSYQVEVWIDTEGHFDVTERYDLHFSQYKHGIYRNILTKYDLLTSENIKEKREIKIVGVEVPNHKFEASSSFYSRMNGYSQIKIGDPDRTIIGNQTYEIRYRVKNAFLYEEDATRFYWNLKPTDWYPAFKNVSFKIHFPPESEVTLDECFIYSGPIGNNSLSESFQLALNENTLIGTSLTGEQFKYGEAVTALVELKAGSIKEHKPLWPFWNRYGWTLILGLYGFFFYLIWRMIGKDDKVTTTTSYYPPRGIDPAMAGYLINDRQDTSDLISLIPYWGYKGLLKMETIDKKGWFAKDDTRIIKLKDLPSGSPAYQKTLFRELFRHGTGDSVLISKLKNKFYTDMARAKTQLKAAARKYYSPRSRTTRTIVYVALSLLLFLVTPVFLFFWGILAAVTAVVSFIVMLILNRYMIKKNTSGNQVFTELKGFREFIKTAEKGKLEMLLKESPIYFESTMGYAMAFGEFKDWARKFEDLNVPPPNWYSTHSSGLYNMNSFSRSFSDTMSSASATMVSSPSSSGSGSGGGGFSGGGFGGGGGGSW